MFYQRIVKPWVLFLVALLTFVLVRFFLISLDKKLDFTAKQMPIVDGAIPQPEITARSAIVVDLDSGAVVFQKDPYLRLNPASITKMITAITALETFPVDEVVTVNKEYPVGKNMGLKAGERITIKNLIYGLLVHSANDAAYVLAGQDDSKIRVFIERMNAIARQEGLNDTHFVNFDGEEDDGHYSTVFDLAHLTRWALKNKIFSEAVQLKEITVYDVDNKIEHQMESTNELLSLEEIKGVKTGWTPKSGECFVGLLDLADHRLVTVILSSGNRFGETEKMVAWAKEAISWQKTASE